MSDTGSEAYPEPVPGSGVTKPLEELPKDTFGTDSSSGDASGAGTSGSDASE